MGFSGLAAYLSEGYASNRLSRYLVAMRHRAPAGYRVWSNNSVLRLPQGDTRLPEAPMILAGFLRRSLEKHDAPLVHGVMYNAQPFPSTDKSPDKALRTMSEYLADCDGSYALIAPCGEGLIFARDPMGQKPLCFERSAKGLGLASDSYALSEQGSAVSVEPGKVYYMDLNRDQRIQIPPPKPSFPVPASLQEAAVNTLTLLSESLDHRAISGSKVAVASSGGIDSALIAHLLSKRCNVTVFSVSAEGSKDAVEAKRFVKALDAEHKEISVSAEAVTEIIPSVSKLIGGGSPMDLGIGTAIHLAAKAACEDGFEVLFLGQLADELFGGYSRYLHVLKSRGEAAVTQTMHSDVHYAYRSNFERDERAASPFLDLVLPYAYLPLVQYALNIPLTYKLDSKSGERKIVLKRAAAEAGVPEEIWSKPKKAVQYSSGLQKIVEKFLS
ncbi:MAG: asparagine synthetase B [Thaumarchaeota archaeon]|nr:asparagine synthetase B [Nitrososphaerota archaeon]